MLHLIEIFEFGLALKSIKRLKQRRLRRRLCSNNLIQYSWLRGYFCHEYRIMLRVIDFQPPVGLTGVLATTVSLVGEYAPKPFWEEEAAVK